MKGLSEEPPFVLRPEGKDHVQSKERCSWQRVQQEQKPWGRSEFGMFREFKEGPWALSVVSRGTVVGSEVGRVSRGHPPSYRHATPATIHSLYHCPMVAVEDYRRLGGLNQHTFILLQFHGS